MCYNCYSSMDNEDNLIEFNKLSHHPNFKIWNTTSLNMLYLGVLGLNGKEVRKIALTISEKFIIWLLTMSKMDSIQFRYSTSNIICTLNFLKNREITEEETDESMMRILENYVKTIEPNNFMI